VLNRNREVIKSSNIVKAEQNKRVRKNALCNPEILKKFRRRIR